MTISNNRVMHRLLVAVLTLATVSPISLDAMKRKRDEGENKQSNNVVNTPSLAQENNQAVTPIFRYFLLKELCLRVQDLSPEIFVPKEIVNYIFGFYMSYILCLLMDEIDKNLSNYRFIEIIDKHHAAYGLKLSTEALVRAFALKGISFFDFKYSCDDTLLHRGIQFRKIGSIEVLFCAADKSGSNDDIWKWVCNIGGTTKGTALHEAWVNPFPTDLVRALLQNICKRFGKEKVLEFINIKNKSGNTIMNWHLAPRPIKEILGELGIEHSIS